MSIGNSHGVRLPETLRDKYAIGGAVVVEEREEGLLLRRKKDRRLSWKETFQAMAHEREDWSDHRQTAAGSNRRPGNGGSAAGVVPSSRGPAS